MNSLKSLLLAIKKRIFEILLFLVMIIIFVSVIIIIYEYVSIFSTNLSHNNSDWGTFGDYIGGILNPFLSFFAFLALLITICYQRKEIRDNRREIRIQEFRSDFFSMINYYYKIIESLRCAFIRTTGSYLHKGHDCFYYYRKCLYNNFTTEDDALYNFKYTIDNHPPDINGIWKELDNYFNHITNIMELIEHYCIKYTIDKNYYRSFFINQISREELSVLRYFAKYKDVDLRHTKYKTYFKNLINDTNSFIEKSEPTATN